MLSHCPVESNPNALSKPPWLSFTYSTTKRTDHNSTRKRPNIKPVFSFAFVLPKWSKEWTKLIQYSLKSHLCYSTITCKVLYWTTSILLNQPQRKVGQCCANSQQYWWHHMPFTLQFTSEFRVLIYSYSIQTSAVRTL